MNVKLTKSKDLGHQDASMWILSPYRVYLFYGKTWKHRTHPLISPRKPLYNGLAWVRCLHLPVGHSPVSIEQVPGEKIPLRPWECHALRQTSKLNSALCCGQSQGLLNALVKTLRAVMASTLVWLRALCCQSFSVVLQILLLCPVLKMAVFKSLPFSYLKPRPQNKEGHFQRVTMGGRSFKKLPHILLPCQVGSP